MNGRPSPVSPFLSQKQKQKKVRGAEPPTLRTHVSPFSTPASVGAHEQWRSLLCVLHNPRSPSNIVKNRLPAFENGGPCRWVDARKVKHLPKIKQSAFKLLEFEGTSILEIFNTTQLVVLATSSSHSNFSFIPSLTQSNSLWGPKRDPLYIVVPLTVVYSLIFLTGVIGNVSTCIVIARNRHMHTATNYYLFSLAISDLLLLVSGLPTEMYTLWSKYPYVFGETFCIVSGLASETSSNATVLTITAFTVERYVAICHPFLTHTFSKLSRAIKFVIAIWIIALACAVPQAAQTGLVYEVDNNGEKVSEEYKICGMKIYYPYSFEISTVLFFFAPMSVITVLYILIGIKLHRSASRKSGQRLRDSRKCSGYGTTRVVKMLVVVVVAFFICWAPFQAQRLFALYGANTSPKMILMYKAITYMSGLLYYLSTTINPFLYNIMSLKFREAFKSTLTRCLSRDMRSEAAGSSGGGVAPRFNYSVLSHRSARNSNNSNNNNNSFSSGNSYVDQVDLHRRPLVVSFKRKSATVSLDYICPNQKNLLHVPMRKYHSPFVVRQKESPKATSNTNPVEKKQMNGSSKIPRIEDIEIFHESRLKIERKRGRRKDEEAQSCSIEEKKTVLESDVTDSLSIVKKSFTAPCLMIK